MENKTGYIDIIKKIVGLGLIFLSIYLALEPLKAIINLDIKGFLYVSLKAIYSIPVFYVGIYLVVGKEAFIKFLISNMLDFIGIITYLIPGLGETGDVAWAPMQSLGVYMLYGYKKGAILSGAEEILPGTDIIPSATILWLYDQYKKAVEKG